MKKNKTYIERKLGLEYYEKPCKICAGFGSLRIDRYRNSDGDYIEHYEHCYECDGTGKMPWTTMIKDGVK